MTDISIRCSSVSKSFGPVRAVEGVSLTLSKGRVLALLGPSGCGKTTTLRLLAGFEVPDEGIVEIGGRAVVGNGSFIPPEKRRVGMVFQDYALFPHLDVAGNVAYGINKADDCRSRVKAILTLVGLSGLESRMPHELSGGQQQRVALARALVPRPDVVLLDEPFSNLDASLRGQVRREVREILRAADATAVFVTHDQEEALSLADQVALMMEGRIVQLAEPEELYHRPATKQVATFVGDADFIPAEIAGGEVTCELGLLRSQSRLAGKVDLMLRPENIALAHDRDGLGEVVSREFFGHDQLITVRLATGSTVRSRMGPSIRVSPGDRVQIQACDDVVVFNRAD
ncbi:MAG: ABC transporter ATP-binding protein [Chloroflexi bacterium]|nr:ABC transporter ATP-binding protein [Chloroflexota bacterium]